MICRCTAFVGCILVAVLVLSADIRNIRADVRALGAEVKTDIASLRTEVKTDTAELRADMDARLAEIQKSLVQINNRSFIQIGSGNNRQ